MTPSMARLNASGNVHFALVAAALGETMVLPESEMRISEVR